METRLIFGYVLLFVIVTQITALGAPTIFEDTIDNPEDLVCQPTGFTSAVICFFSNFTILFEMMQVSATYAFLSAILITPFIVIMVILVLRLLTTLL